jgi:uncharacterized RDD family membrane protein YckC
MKCPKCGYLGFETSDRCRNCGYDFSLAVEVESPAELPLRSSDGPIGPLADFELSDADGPIRSGSTPSLNLDRIIGSPQAPTPSRGAGPLPLFPSDAVDDPPLAPPRPAKPPLSVRRTTPEVQKGRARQAPPQLEMIDEESAPPPGATILDRRPDRVAEQRPPIEFELPLAGAGPRLLAALIDLLLLAAIDSLVIYLTLALAGIGRESIGLLPLAPMAGFFAILNGGYLAVFVAASGQTLGKMLTGIRVMGEDGRRVDIGGAVLRAVGCGLSLLTVGLGYLPAFFAADRRALQDRIAGTRVVSAR